MAVLLVASTWAIRALHPGFAWVQAFAEAALVGGLADWFAVTALFRHPMNLPIPHTAIIPRSKDRIGDALATFLRTNFLTPRIVARRLEQFDAAGAIAGFLESPSAGGRVRRSTVQLLRQLAATPAADAVFSRLHEGAMRKLEDIEAAPLLGRMLDAMMEDGRHRPVIDALVAWAARTLDSQEGLIRKMVEERTAWLLRLLSVDNKVADGIVDGLRGLLNDLAVDPNHPMRERAETALLNLAFELQHDPRMQEKVERVKRELLRNRAVGEWVEGMWAKVRSFSLGLMESEAAGEISTTMAQGLREGPQLRSAINQLVRRAVVGVVADHGHAIVTLVSETVRGWDARTVTEKMESAVSRDLQYIRLNGTLIGGLIGVAIHALLTGADMLAR